MSNNEEEANIVSFSVEKVQNGHLYIVTQVDGVRSLYVNQIASPPSLERLRERLVEQLVEPASEPVVSIPPAELTDAESEDGEVQIV